MTRWPAWTLILLLGACQSSDPKKPQPGAGAKPGPGVAGAKKAPVVPAKAPPPEPEKKVRVFVPRSYPPALPIQPVKTRPLVEAPVGAEATHLLEAHYDAEGLGLKELQYTLEFKSKRGATEAKASGWWQSGAPPVVKLLEVRKAGKKLVPPGKNPEEVGQKIAWEALSHKLLKLVDGMGNGFLARRLFDWKALSGTVKLQKKKLTLKFKQEFGETEVLVGEGYVVQKVTVRSKGIVRSMSYESRTEQGRNLVNRARLKAFVEKGAKLPKRAHKVMQAADGTTFELAYSKVGRYLMPVKLRKVIPALGEDLTLTITYKSAKP